MKICYIKFIIIILFSTTLLSQPTTQMPDTWHPDFSNSYIRKPINITNRTNTTLPKTNKGRLYNTISIKNETNTTTFSSFQNNNYYHSHGFNYNTTQNITYSTPIQIELTPIPISKDTENSDDIITTKNRTNALNRNDKPYDPSKPVPIEDATIPMLIFAFIWTIKKKYSNK